jgi:hypothetical protein
MPFKSPKAREAFFERLKSSGGMPLPNKPGMAPMPAPMGGRPLMPMTPPMPPPVPGMVPGGMGAPNMAPMRVPGAAMGKPAKFPKLKKYF